MPPWGRSRRTTDPSWDNSSVITLDEAAGLKDRYQGDILVAGSGQLVRGLAGRGLVDEYGLMVFPLILGAGKRLFDGAAMTRLTLTDITPVGPWRRHHPALRARLVSQPGGHAAQAT